jgi:hypothetical protein
MLAHRRRDFYVSEMKNKNNNGGSVFNISQNETCQPTCDKANSPSSAERQYLELTFDELPSFSQSTTFRNKLVVCNDTPIPLNSSGKPDENF